VVSLASVGIGVSVRTRLERRQQAIFDASDRKLARAHDHRAALRQGRHDPLQAGYRIRIPRHSLPG